MKLVINISETQYRECIEYKNQKYAPTCKDVDSMFLSIATGTPLPKTNGEVIRTLFPDKIVGECGDWIFIGGVEVHKHWWDSEYKEGNE